MKPDIYEFNVFGVGETIWINKFEKTCWSSCPDCDQEFLEPILNSGFTMTGSDDEWPDWLNSQEQVPGYLTCTNNVFRTLTREGLKPDNHWECQHINDLEVHKYPDADEFAEPSAPEPSFTCFKVPSYGIMDVKKKPD